MKIKQLCAFILLAALIPLCSGCSLFSLQPPKAAETDRFVTEHYEMIQTVADYLLSFDNTDYEAVYVQENGKTITLYWSSHKTTNNPFTLDIENDEVTECIQVLRREGCKRIEKSIGDNAVYFQMWSRDIGEADCGFACPIDGSREPSIAFQTECTPLSKENWYYCLSDYEEWRVRNR